MALNKKKHLLSSRKLKKETKSYRDNFLLSLSTHLKSRFTTQSVLLVVLCITVFVSHIFYVVKTYQYPEWDEHLFMDYAIKFYDILSKPNSNFFSELGLVFSDRQPLFPLTLSIPLLFFGTSQAYKISLAINGIYFVSTIVGIYFIGKQFFSKTTSLIAAFLFSTYGFPLFYLHFVYSETASTAFVVFSLLFLSKTNFFSNTKNTILFSIFFTLGNVTRWTVPIFVIGPLVWVLLVSLFRLRNKKQYKAKLFLKNVFFFLLIGVVFPLSIYYIPKAGDFISYIHSNTNNAEHWVSTINYLSPELVNTFSVRSIMFYFNIISQQTVFYFVLFSIGFLLCLRFLNKYIFLLLAFSIPYCFFTFVSVFKDDRFIVPLYPSMALISAVVFQYLRPLVVKNLLIVGIIVWGVLTFIGASWGAGPLGKQGLKDIVLPEFIHHPRRIYLTTMVWPPRENITNADRVAHFLEYELNKTDKLPVFLLAFRNHPFDAAFCKIVCYEKRYLQYPPDSQIRGLQANDYGGMFSKIKNADYIAFKNIDPVEERFDEPMLVKFNQIVSTPSAVLPPAFKEYMTFQMSVDSSTITIYKKTKPLTENDIVVFSNYFIKAIPNDKTMIEKAVDSVR